MRVCERLAAMRRSHPGGHTGRLALAASLVLFGMAPAAVAQSGQPAITGRAVPVITVEGRRFRDLNRNGTLDRYEDWRLTPAERAADLVARMTLDEKAGQMVVAEAPNNAPFGQPATGYAMDVVTGLVKGGHVTSFNSRLVLNAGALAKVHNDLQAAMEQGRLGIPAVMTTDPRHHFQTTAGASVAAGSFSQWPESLGLAAIGDPALVKRFGDTVRREFRATGFVQLLGPQIDLATEPRWARINGTFGEDAALSGRLAVAYVVGLQGGADGIGGDGVAAVVKHFAGYGAAKDGWDAHNRYGRMGDLGNDRLGLHLRPFADAFKVRPAGVMPAYTVQRGLIVDGKPVEEVGAAYSKVLISDLLRDRMRFDGVVLSDWAITEDCGTICMNGFPAGQHPTFDGISTAWGVERLTKPQRFALAIGNGVDQFGGVMDPSPIVTAVKSGLLGEAAIDRAVTRILAQSFALGIFEHPFVDADAAVRNVGTAADRTAARDAQARAMVVLEARRPLALPAGTRVLLRNVDAAAARAAGFTVVDRAQDADVAIVRTAAPFETLHPNYTFGSMQHEGSLAYHDNHPDLAAVRALPAKLPVVVDVYLDRPAILTPFKDRATVLLGDFGATDAALFDVLSGKVTPVGRLPFELPSSMAAVVAQRSDTPADSAAPLYPLHYRAPMPMQK